MRKFAILGSISILAACAPVEQGMSQGTDALISLQNSLTPLNDLVPPGYSREETCKNIQIDHDGSLSYKLIGIFPNKDVNNITNHQDYQLKCPNFTIRNYFGNQLIITGLSPYDLDRILNHGSYGVPYLLGVGLDFWLDFTKPGVIGLASKYGVDSYRTDYVIAAKQGSGKLTPILYHGQYTPFVYDPTQPVNVYVPINPNQYHWSRLTWNASQKQFTFTQDIPIPSF